MKVYRPHIWFQNGKWHCGPSRRLPAGGSGATQHEAWLRWQWAA